MPQVPLNFSVLNVKLLNLSKHLPLCSINVQCFRHSSNQVQKDVSYEQVSFDNEEHSIFEKEAIIESKRNKSRLNKQHRNILLNKIPYPEPMAPHHCSVKFNRKVFAKFGQNSGINPGIAWPTKEDLADVMEYESVAYPHTIQQMIKNAKDRIEKENRMDDERQKKISQQLLQLDQWKADIESRAAKKLAIATAAKEKKEKLIEEVRRHFGYKVDPRDDRFKEMLAQKEKASKKEAKEARTKAKQDEYMAKVLEKNTDLKEEKNTGLKE